MNAQTGSTSIVLERRTTWVASDARPTLAPAARTTAAPRVRGFAKVRRWFTRTFDFRDAFTPTSAW